MLEHFSYGQTYIELTQSECGYLGTVGPYCGLILTEIGLYRQNLVRLPSVAFQEYCWSGF